MVNEQPEALRLANELEDSLYSADGTSLSRYCQGIADEAAAELRRLHESNTELLAALKGFLECPYDIDPATVPKAGIEAAPMQVVGNMSVALVRIRQAKAAIAKAERTPL